MRDDSLIDEIHKVETIIQDFKTTQGIAGDSWQVYRNQTDNIYDLSFLGTNTSATFKKRYKATLQLDAGLANTNAFCIWVPKFEGTNGPFTDPYGNEYTMNAGFDWAYEDAGDDPLSVYVSIVAGYNWDATTSTHLNVKFRCLSPYKGKIKFEEVF